MKHVGRGEVVVFTGHLAYAVGLALANLVSRYVTGVFCTVGTGMYGNPHFENKLYIKKYSGKTLFYI